MEKDTTTPASTTNNGKSSDGKGWKIAAAFSFVVAICGIGFGIYGMVQSSQKDNQISDLKAQVSNNGKTSEPESSSAGQREQGYLYLDEFGLKIKVPDDTLITSYAYVNDLGTYEIWAIPKDKKGLKYSLDTTRNQAVRISRYSKSNYDCKSSCGTQIFANDEYLFMIRPQNSTITNYDGTVDEELNTAVGGLVHDQYSNNTGFFGKDNYSEL